METIYNPKARSSVNLMAIKSLLYKTKRGRKCAHNGNALLQVVYIVTVDQATALLECFKIYKYTAKHCELKPLI